MYQRSRKMETAFRYTNLFAASDSPPPGMVLNGH